MPNPLKSKKEVKSKINLTLPLFHKIAFRSKAKL